MSAPALVGIGDSIAEASNTHRGYCRDITADNNPPAQYIYHVARALDCSYQNMAIGGQTTTSMATRFAADVVAAAPKYALIEGGVNDVAYGVLTLATTLTNYTTMLDACRTAGIIPIVLSILPWTAGTAEQSQDRDARNAAIRDLVLRYDGAVYVDAAPYVGQYRAGGDADNLWDILPGYTYDDTHYLPAGYVQIARAIADAIEREYGGVANDLRILPTDYVADVSFGGDILDRQIAGEILALLDVVYLKSDGKWWKIDADAEATGAGLLGVTMQAASADGELQILVRGTIRNDAWAWTVGGNLYLSTDAGALTQTAPSGTSDVVRLAGVAYSADMILFAPDLHYSVVT